MPVNVWMYSPSVMLRAPSPWLVTMDRASRPTCTIVEAQQSSNAARDQCRRAARRSDGDRRRRTGRRPRNSRTKVEAFSSERSRIATPGHRSSGEAVVAADGSPGGTDQLAVVVGRGRGRGMEDGAERRTRRRVGRRERWERCMTRAASALLGVLFGLLVAAIGFRDNSGSSTF